MKCKFVLDDFFCCENVCCAGAERVCPPSAARESVAVPNGEDVASCGATPNSPHQTPHYKSPECLQIFYCN